MSLPNIYHHRKVAEASAKACYICYKNSTSVLITPDNKDFFYICPGHLKDRGFAQPLDVPNDEEAKKKLREEELQQEIERVKKEYEEKQKAKKEKKKKDKDKDKKSDKDEKKPEDDKVAEKEKDDKIQELEKKKSEAATPTDPRVFALQKHIYQMRIQKLQNAAMAKKNQERLRDPLSFPSTPTGNP